jgi:tripartite ATP-independent transporter DctP family solute receptor
MNKNKLMQTAIKMAGTAWLAAGAALLSLPSQAAEYEFNLVHLSNTSDEDYDGALVLKDYVETQSNGRIGVNIYSGGQLCGNAVECLEALQANLVQVFITTTGGVANVFPQIQALDIPYLFPSDRVAECALSSESLNDAIRSEVLQQTGNLRLMTIGNTGGWRNFATTKKQIKAPADVQGLKIRTVESPIQMELVKSMGGSPTAVAWPEVYTSLATGVVEGTKNGITDIMGMKFNEHVKYMTLDGHAYMAALWWMNNDAFLQLPDDLKKIVIDGFDALRSVTIVMPKRRQIEAYEAFKAGGGVIYAPTAEEKASFEASAKPVQDWFAREYGNQWLDITRQAVDACSSDLEKGYVAHN